MADSHNNGRKRPGAMAMLMAAAMLVAAATRSVDAHGWMEFPPARNVLVMQRGTNAEKDSIQWCPHCGQGRGLSKPGGIQTGICGDPYQSVTNPALAPLSNNANPPTGRFYGFGATLTQGQNIDFKIWLDTNHGGRMQFSVCPLPKEQATQGCFDADANKLRRVSPGSPNQDGKLYWYIPAGTTDKMYVTATFKLPAGVSCAGGCMIQWTWIATQTCSPPCESPAVDVPGQCGYNLVWNNPNVCADYTAQAEWFRNCADVIILPSGITGGTTTSGGTTTTGGTIPAPSPPPPRSPPPSPPPPASGTTSTSVTCQPWDWQCQKCVTAGQGSSIAASFVSRCVACASGQQYADACVSCLTGSPFNAAIIGGCLDCIAQRPSILWSCRDVCSTWRCSAS